MSLQQKEDALLIFTQMTLQPDSGIRWSWELIMVKNKLGWEEENETGFEYY